MNLDELLKVNSARCVKTKVHEDLVEGEIYKVEGFNDETIKIVDRNGFSSWHNKNLFEPVINNDVSKSNSEIDISENSVNDVNNVNTTFKVGDKVYVFGSGEIHTIIATVSPHHALLNNTSHPVSMETLTLANDYSYNMLTQLFENIVFEPPKR